MMSMQVELRGNGDPEIRKLEVQRPVEVFDGHGPALRRLRVLDFPLGGRVSDMDLALLRQEIEELTPVLSRLGVWITFHRRA